MAELDSYSELNTEVALWMGRSDLTSRIPVGIRLCEAKINRKLRTLDMETKNAAFSITGEFVPVPIDFGTVKTFYITSTSARSALEFMGDDQMTNLFTSGTGQPKYYNISGGNFRFAKIPDTTYTATLLYTVKVPNLTSTASSNWLLEKHPDAYLYGTLAEMCALAKDGDASKAYRDAMYAVLEEIKEASKHDSTGGGMTARAG